MIPLLPLPVKGDVSLTTSGCSLEEHLSINQRVMHDTSPGNAEALTPTNMGWKTRSCLALPRPAAPLPPGPCHPCRDALCHFPLQRGHGCSSQPFTFISLPLLWRMRLNRNNSGTLCLTYPYFVHPQELFETWVLSILKMYQSWPALEHCIPKVVKSHPERQKYWVIQAIKGHVLPSAVSFCAVLLMLLLHLLH